MHLYQKTTFTLLVLLICCSASVSLDELDRHFSNGPDPVSKDQSSKEITIRNMTKMVVRYTYKPVNSKLKATTRSLQPGAIDRLSTAVPLDLDYQAGGTAIMTRVDPGMFYNFRYNEKYGLELFQGSHGRNDAPDLAPFVPTPMIVVEKMLELARIDKDDVLFDLGCGDGRIVITAAKKYGIRGVGIDIVPDRIDECHANAEREGVGKLVEFRLEDVTKAIFAEATVVTLYLLPESNELLRPHLEKQLKPGARVVSHNYHIPGWKAKEIHFVTIKDEEGQEHNIYVYTI